MSTTSAAALGALLGRVADDRPPLYAALADRVRLLVTDGRLPVGCRLPPEQWVPPPPDAWEVARQEEVRLLGPEALRHIRRCVPRAGVGFAFNVRADGRVSAFNDAGEWGRIGPSPEDARELARIERALLTDPRCRVFPEQLRGRYVSVAAGSGRMEIRQVRDDSAPGRAELPTNR